MRLLLFFLKQEEMAVTDEMDQLEQRLGICNCGFFSLVVCNGLQHFVRACTFCAILSQLALQHRYHEANIQLLEQRRCWGNNWFKTLKSVEQNSVVITKIYLAWLYSWYRTYVFRLNFSQCKSQNVLRGRFWETSDLLKISRIPVTQTLKGKHFELA